MDVCDKHDFEPCQEIHLGTDHIDYLGHSDKCCDRWWVYLDGKLLSGLSDHLKEDREKIVKYINSYLETDLVSHISYLVDYQQNLDMWVTKIYINNDNTENLSQIMEQLSSVPGITKLYCHCLLVKIGV